jgi:hypothetical protein
MVPSIFNSRNWHSKTFDFGLHVFVTMVFFQRWWGKTVIESLVCRWHLFAVSVTKTLRTAFQLWRQIMQSNFSVLTQLYCWTLHIWTIFRKLTLKVQESKDIQNMNSASIITRHYQRAVLCLVLAQNSGLVMWVRRWATSLVMFAQSWNNRRVCSPKSLQVKVIFMVGGVYCDAMQVVKLYNTNIFVLKAPKF